MLRWRRMKGLVRKLTGLLLAAAGIGIIYETLPAYLWLILGGGFLIWLGWSLFQLDIC